MTAYTPEQQESIERISKTLSLTEDTIKEYIDQTGDDDLNDIEEAYYGNFSSDVSFAEDMAESTGALVGIDDSVWPANCIDWDFAARELMHDYFSINGSYFRSL